jgi:hypothetical protein
MLPDWVGANEHAEGSAVPANIAAWCEKEIAF